MSNRYTLADLLEGPLKPYASILQFKPTETGWAVPPENRTDPFTKAGRQTHPHYPARFTFHTSEIIHRTPQDLRHTFSTFGTPPHFWMGISELNSILYPQKSSGSRKRALSKNKLSLVNRAKEPVSREAIPFAGSGFDLLLQRIPFLRSAWALLGTKASGVPTNLAGYIHPQVEIDGYAGDTNNWDYYTLLKASVPLTQFVRWMRTYTPHKTYVAQPYRRTGQEAGTYGTSGAARMTKDEWRLGRSANGKKWNTCHHQNVPGNKHWDCGRLQLDTICRWANWLASELDGVQAQTAPQQEARQTVGKDELRFRNILRHAEAIATLAK